MNRIDARFDNVASPTVTAGAYTIGDVIGGLLTFDKAFDTNVPTGEIRAVHVSDKAAQAKDLTLYVFDRQPASIADNAAFDPTDAELATIVAIIPITDHKSFADNGISYANNIAIPVRSADARTLYAYLVADEAPTYAAVADVSVRLVIVQD